jgi:hypothetical protein
VHSQAITVRCNQVADGHADGHDSEMNVMGDGGWRLDKQKEGEELVAGVVGGERPTP